MPNIHVSKSILIKAPAEQIYRKLNDFSHWTAWSPWLIQEPEAKVDVSVGGKSYAWEGKRIGSGNMAVTAETRNQSIDYDLTFLKPWKSTAKVRFELEPKGESTEVTWFMDSSLPFFLFWMKKSMTAFIESDYQRGLALLKDYAEDGEAHSRLDFKGASTFPGCSYLGIRTNCSMDAVGKQMQDDFTRIWTFIGAHQGLVAGEAFSIYHKWDMVNGRVAYTSGVPVKKIPEDLPEGMLSGKIPQSEVYTVRHTGPYLHLGNAWSALFTMQRTKAFKANKQMDPFETYVNLPGEVPENELITEIHFPIQ